MHMRVKGGQTQMSELDDGQFERWAALLEQRLGIAVTPQRKGFLSSKLRLRMREMGLESFQDYYDLVSSARQGTQEWSRLLDQLTVHETRFNRHPASFRLIEEYYLPLLQQRSGRIDVRAWSVGCASGEEAYYLAMVLDRAMAQFPSGQKVFYGVLGTDVSLESLSQARQGCYPRQRLAQLETGLLNSYFVQRGDEYCVIDKLRQRVAFSQINVQALSRAPFEGVDIIYCQNLLIYFAQEKRHEIVNALARFLKPGGIMILGVGEIVGWNPKGLERVRFEDTLAYRRTAE